MSEYARFYKCDLHLHSPADPSWREAATEIIGAATENDLRRALRHWKAASDPYMRTIFHTMAHVRQIWLLRGALGLTDGKPWPQQHWA